MFKTLGEMSQEDIRREEQAYELERLEPFETGLPPSPESEEAE